MKTTALLSLLLLLVPSRALDAQSLGIIPPAGRPLPELRLPLPNGEIVTTKDMLGQRIVLHVFASW